MHYKVRLKLVSVMDARGINSKFSRRNFLHPVMCQRVNFFVQNMSHAVARVCLCEYRALPFRLQSSLKTIEKYRALYSINNRLNLVSSSTAAGRRLFSSQLAAETVKKHANIGTIGHVDHGKTTLTGNELMFKSYVFKMYNVHCT